MSTSGSAAYELDEDAKIVKHPEKGEFRIWPKEYALLSFLHEHPGKLFSSDELIEKVWKQPAKFYDHDLVRVTVYNLRKRVGADIVDSVWGYGYGIGISLPPR